MPSVTDIVPIVMNHFEHDQMEYCSVVIRVFSVTVTEWHDCMIVSFYSGQIAGIVIGVLAAVAIIIAATVVIGVVFYKQRTGVC